MNNEPPGDMSLKDKFQFYINEEKKLFAKFEFGFLNGFMYCLNDFKKFIEESEKKFCESGALDIFEIYLKEKEKEHRNE